MTAPELPARFCSHCGLSIVPPATSHVARPCATCGKTIYKGPEPGRGLEIMKGDQVVFPPGSIQLSLNPAIGSQFSRLGLRWFVQNLFSGTKPTSADDLETLLAYYRTEAENCLERSENLKDLDLSTEAGVTEAAARLKEGEPTQELFAMSLIGNASGVLEELESNKDVRRAVWYMYLTERAFSLLTVREKHFEETLWRGHLAYSFLHRAKSAADQSPAEAQALEALAPQFARLSEATLKTWSEDARSIAPRLGVDNIPEETLRARVKVELGERERARQLSAAETELSYKREDLRVKKVAAVAVASGATFAVLVPKLLKLLEPAWHALVSILGTWK